MRSESGIDRGVEYDARLALWHVWYGYRERWFAAESAARKWAESWSKRK